MLAPTPPLGWVRAVEALQQEEDSHDDVKPRLVLFPPHRPRRIRRRRPRPGPCDRRSQGLRPGLRPQRPGPSPGTAIRSPDRGAFQDGPCNVATVSLEADGVCFSYVQDVGMGIGRWRTTGDQTGEMVNVHQYFAAEPLVEDLFDPDYVSPGHAFEPGTFVERIALTVDTGGELATVVGTYGFYAPDGSLEREGDWEQTWTRLVPAIAMDGRPRRNHHSMDMPSLRHDSGGAQPRCRRDASA